MIGRLVQRLHEEDGIALVMALAIVTILSVTTAGILVAGTANQRTTYVSNQERQAFAIAQEGLAYAEGMVSHAYGSTLPSGPQPLLDLPPGSSGTYEATPETDAETGETWYTMVGTGTVQGVTRKVSAKTDVGVQTASTSWNYVYVDSNAGHSTGACETTIQGGTTVKVPLIVRDNLCFAGGGKYIGDTLEVGNDLSISGTSSYVGTSSSPVAKVEVAGTCANRTTTGTTPGTPPCNGNTAGLYASTIGTTLDVPTTMPAVDFQSMYTAQARLTKSGCPTNLFDNDTTLNDSLGSNVAATLFGTTAYDCFVGSQDELRWSGGSCSTGTLYVKGTLYFDGGLLLTSGCKIVYSGQATLYFTGGLTFQGNFCATTDCSTTGWDPSVNGIVVVAKCDGIASGSACVYVNGGIVQVGVYCPGLYQVDGNGANMGPVLAETVSLSGGSSTIIPFADVPQGTPFNGTTTYSPPTPPSDWSG